MGTDPGVLCSLLHVKVQHHRKTGRCHLDAVHSGYSWTHSVCTTQQLFGASYVHPCLALWALMISSPETLGPDRTIGAASPQRALLIDEEQVGRGNKAALNPGWKGRLNWPHTLPLKWTLSDLGCSLCRWLCSVGSLYIFQRIPWGV